MKCEILISTMNLKNNNNLISKMNINGNSLTINQVTMDNIELKNDNKSKNRLISVKDKGLSKSRNLAILNSNADICVIADDDLVYCNNYEKIITEAYTKIKDADIIAFRVNNCKVNNKYKNNKISFLESFKICSVQVTFKRNSIFNNKILFDERFGAGSKHFILGEENIFLTDCIKKGLKIYFVDETIATLSNGKSTWFLGYNRQYFMSKGACFYRINKLLSPLLIIQFAVRKNKIYKNEMDLFKSIKYMFDGIKNFKKIN